jgi:hypothetical protein
MINRKQFLIVPVVVRTKCRSGRRFEQHLAALPNCKFLKNCEARKQNTNDGGVTSLSHESVPEDDIAAEQAPERNLKPRNNCDTTQFGGDRSSKYPAGELDPL